jgi:ankyrin repeat protein
LPPWAEVDTALLQAVQLGHIDIVRLLLLEWMPQVQRGVLSAALCEAALKGHNDIVSLLIEQGADINRQPHKLGDNCEGAMVGHVAVIVALLIAQGADMTGETERFFTPLMHSLLSQHWSTAQLLMDKGARVSYLPLVFAVRLGAPALLVSAMISKGARDAHCLAICTAAYHGCLDTVRVLLAVEEQAVSRQENVARLSTALGAAAGMAHLPVADHLLQVLVGWRQANLLDPSTHQHLLSEGLHMAVETATCICEANDSSADDSEDAEQDVECIPRVQPATQARIAVVQQLLQQGADPNYRGGGTLACAVLRQYRTGAVPCRDHAILQLLLDAGANNIDAALQAAAQFGDTTAFPKLLAATQGTVDQQGKALLAAATRGTASMVMSLMHRKANVAAALSAAAATSNVEAATMILEHPQVRVTDQGLKQQLVDLAARSQSFSLMWALSISVGMLDDCELAVASKDRIARKQHLH